MSLSRKLALRVLHKISTIDEVIDLLKKYKMLTLLPSIKQAIVQISGQEEKKDSIVIDSPFPLSDASVHIIKRIVGNDLAHHEVVINKSILAGFQARFRGKLYDGSAQRIIKQLVSTNN